LRHNDLTAATRVLDVGCGPGTNARWFDGVDYLGLDINPHYVETARRRYGRTFQVADVRTFAVGRDERFDFILLNSLLHHIDTDNVYKILRQLCGQLTPCGAVHILELVLPRRPSIARCLARCDRGEYPRLLEEWKTIFTDVFDEVLWEPYPVRGCGMTLWNMVYFKGTAPRPAGRAGGDGDAQREDQATGPGVASTAARADDDVPAFVSGRNR
jgi:SAM-dependent methyltransferase